MLKPNAHSFVIMNLRDFFICVHRLVAWYPKQQHSSVSQSSKTKCFLVLFGESISNMRCFLFSMEGMFEFFMAMQHRCWICRMIRIVQYFYWLSRRQRLSVTSTYWVFCIMKCLMRWWGLKFGFGSILAWITGIRCGFRCICTFYLSCTVCWKRRTRHTTFADDQNQHCKIFLFSAINVFPKSWNNFTTCLCWRSWGKSFFLTNLGDIHILFASCDSN